MGSLTTWVGWILQASLFIITVGQPFSWACPATASFPFTGGAWAGSPVRVKKSKFPLITRKLFQGAEKGLRAVTGGVSLFMVGKSKFHITLKVPKREIFDDVFLHKSSLTRP